MSETARNVFKQAIQKQPASAPIENKYKTIMNKVIYSRMGWCAVTFVVVFVFLYSLNPPIVQHAKGENELSKPCVNVNLVLLWSIIASLSVIVVPYVVDYVPTK